MANTKKTETIKPKVTKTPKKVVKKVDEEKKVSNVAIPQKTVSQQSVQGGLHVNLLDTTGNVVGTISLPEKIFGVQVNSQLIAQAVRVFLVNQRQGTARTLTRGEVDGSTRKIYRQKGTGRARHGGIRAPLFVKGGIAHGPKLKDYSLTMPKKMKRAALFSALSAKVKDGEIKVVTGLEALEVKTKAFSHAFDTWGIAQKKRNVLFVLPNDMENIYRGVRNMAGVTITTAQRLNTYEVLKHNAIIMVKESIDTIDKVFGKKEEK